MTAGEKTSLSPSEFSRADQRVAPETAPMACDVLLVAGSLFGLLGAAGSIGFGGAAKAEAGVENLKAFCGLPPFKSRNLST